MSVALLILFTIIIVILIVWFIELLKFNKHLWKYKGPTPIPVIGNAHNFGSMTDFIPTVLKFQKLYGGVVKLLIGFHPRLMISDPKVAEFVLGSNSILEKAYEYRYLQPWLGTGLLTSSSKKWKQRRKLITPTFHFQILEQFIDVFDNQGKILVKKLNKKAEMSEPFNIFNDITLYTLDVICEAAMGTFVNAQNDSESEYVVGVKTMGRIIMERAFSLAKMWDFAYKFSADYQLEKKYLKILHSYTNSVITSRRKELADKIKKSNKEDDVGIKKRHAFLDLLLRCSIDGQPLSDECIREEVDTFMFEGHDTTASGISFVLYCLGQYPDVQEKIVKELMSIFNNDKTRPTTYKDLQEMKYMEMAIKEVMRLYPPVPVYGRTLLQDEAFDGQVLPKGLTLTMFPFGLHRQPDIFPDPEKFDPERFSAENSVRRSPYAYLPFSAGPRNCIGKKFAMMEMKSTVCKVLRHFEILAVPDHKPILAAESILKSVNGLLVSLKKRKF